MLVWISWYCSLHFNYSFCAGVVPEHWKQSVITPVPKLPKPVCLADFHPISVRPILSQLAEKFIVQIWLLAAINHQNINNQFAFKPTGSTMCALVFLCIMSLGYLKQILTFVIYLLISLRNLMSLTTAYWLPKWWDLTYLLQFYLGFSLSLPARPSRLNIAFTCRHRNLSRFWPRPHTLDHYGRWPYSTL